MKINCHNYDYLILRQLQHQIVASFSGHSQIFYLTAVFSPQLRDKIWEWPGNKASQIAWSKFCILFVNSVQICSGGYSYQLQYLVTATKIILYKAQLNKFCMNDAVAQNGTYLIEVTWHVSDWYNNVLLTLMNHTRLHYNSYNASLML